MKKKNKKKLKKKYIVILIIVLLIGFSIFRNSRKNVEEKKIEFEEIEKRDIAQSISSSGIVTTSTTKNITSTLTGYKITSVKVKEGDKVNVGDVICTFDISDISKNLADLKKSKDVTQAQSNIGVDSARRSLNDAINNKDLQLPASSSDVDNASKAYSDAVNKLNEAKNNLVTSQNALNAYMPTYNNALAAYNSSKAQNDPKETAYNSAQTEYNIGLATLATAEANYKKYFNGTNQLDPTTGSIIPLAEYKWESYASEEHQKVETAFNEAKAALTKLEQTLATSKVAYEAYRPTFETALKSFTPISNQYQALSKAVTDLQSAVTSLEATANSLKTAYETTKKTYDAAIASSNSSIAGLQDSLKSSELSATISTQSIDSQIRAYSKQIEEGTLKSTVSGTVTSVNAKNGDIYAGSTIAVIEGTESFIVEAEIDEYDIPDVKEGMRVLIKTDATRDEELEGIITYVAVSSTQSLASSSAMGQMGADYSAGTSGNATYKVQIEITSLNDRLRLGMNAKLSIITASKNNVWTVPFEAVHERDDGTKYIEILKNEETEEKEELNVETGLEGTYYIEIKSDKLTDGMKVVLPEIDTSNSIESLIEAMGADVGV